MFANLCMKILKKKNFSTISLNQDKTGKNVKEFRIYIHIQKNTSFLNKKICNNNQIPTLLLQLLTDTTSPLPPKCTHSWNRTLHAFLYTNILHTLCIILPTLLTAVIHNNKTFGHPFLQQRVNLHRKGSIFTTNHLFIVAFHFGICGALFVIAMLHCLYFKRCFFLFLV